MYKDTQFLLGYYSKKGLAVGCKSFFVVLGRIELPTHGFSVHCSTI